MKDFRQLQVWEKSHLLAKDMYRTTALFPKEELFGLTSQLRRASVSIPTNIAEGCGRGSDTDFKRFIQISFGSASEVEYLILLSYELGFVKEHEYLLLSEQITMIKKMLASLINKLKQSTR
ncbi:diversity-generating retroelement protein bAvd family protein [Chryseobacterium sp. 6424]|uniref:four helix bundle protein n=1 Tax=Chryseobacterium sp. 6424 TaxID=2039166 RepID=UPI000EFB76FB|nr:four helix bundle protein [Chryseobacterium sp. 6424]AYO57055.1 diversity-generating retroelement protein bAvd family protein [Chryseobacterium sp. 6424]